MGTNATAGACDRVTGQCPCLPNVVGQQCESCAAHHFNIASGKVSFEFLNKIMIHCHS